MTTQKSGRKRQNPPAIQTDRASTASLQPSIGDPEPAPLPEGLDDNMDPVALRNLATANGYEIHRKRSPRGAIAKESSVKGKVRTTVYIPREKRLLLGRALLDTNYNMTAAIEEAIDDWLKKMNIHQPGS